MAHTDDTRGHHHDPAELHNENVAHEHTDVNIRAILMFAVGLVIVAAVVHVLMALMFNWFEGQAKKNDPQLSPLSATAPEMPKRTTESPYFGHARGGAQLLTNEPVALENLRAEEDKRLHSYGWVEGKPGVAHMPLAEAKKLILERGVPTRAGEPADPTLGTTAAAMGEASSGRTIPTPGRKAAQETGRTQGDQPATTPDRSHRPDGEKH